MSNWYVRRRRYWSKEKWKIYRKGLSEQEAKELAACHNRAFPNDEHEAKERKP